MAAIAHAAETGTVVKLRDVQPDWPIVMAT